MEKKPSPFTVFQDLAKQKGYRPKRATTSLKKENVQFIFQTPSQKDIEVDVKTKKRFKNKSLISGYGLNLLINMDVRAGYMEGLNL